MESFNNTNQNTNSLIDQDYGNQDKIKFDDLPETMIAPTPEELEEFRKRKQEEKENKKENQRKKIRGIFFSLNEIKEIEDQSLKLSEKGMNLKWAKLLNNGG